MKIFVAGTFDRLHVGHQWLLWKALELADEMVVIIATDETVRRIRGRDPLHDEKGRLARLQQENFPHTTIRLGRNDGDFLRTLREESPDILLLGFDQEADEARIKKAFPNLEIRRATKYFPEFFKSSHFRYTKEK